MNKKPEIFTALIILASISLAQDMNAVTTDLVYELDGVEPAQIYATADITRKSNGNDLDFAIAFNTNPEKEEL